MSSSKGANSINQEAVICNGFLESLLATPGHAINRRYSHSEKDKFLLLSTKEKNVLLDQDSCSKHISEIK